MEIRKISCRRPLSADENLVISRCCFAEDGKEMCKDLQHKCTVWLRSRYSRRRGLLKLPNFANRHSFELVYVLLPLRVTWRYATYDPEMRCE